MGKVFASCYQVAACLLLSMLVTATASAQATRTWVSGVGDDANPCSRTAPCKTFAGAISKTATAGVINVLDPGGYGAVTITKAITIVGGKNNGGILNSLSNGIVINAGPTDVIKISDVVIDGGGNGTNGIRFIAGGTLILDGVQVRGNGASGYGLHFNPSGSSKLTVIDSAFSDNIGGGVYIVPGASGFAYVSIENSKATNNRFGFRADDRSVVSIRNSSVSGNTNNGILAYSTAQAVEITVNNCQITNNGIGNPSAAGVRSQGPLASVLISNNTISGNAYGVLADTGADIQSFGNNQIISNWADGTPSGTLISR
jgi:hypothetical protein